MFPKKESERFQTQGRNAWEKDVQHHQKQMSKTSQIVYSVLECLAK